MPVFLRSTTARFFILIFLLQLAATAGLLLFVHEASKRALEREQRVIVSELNDDLLAAYREGGQNSLVNLVNARLTAVSKDIPVILLTAPSGQMIAGNLAAWPTIIPARQTWQTLDLYRLGSKQPEHIGLMSSVLPNGTRLLAGHVIEGDVMLSRINQEAMTVALLIAIPLALLNALLFGRVINQRVRAISHITESVGQGDLTRRVRSDGTSDAFDALGTGVNAMLDQIEGLVTELRIVTDGLAHDLRSPITRLKSVVEQALIDVDDAKGATALARVSAETETVLSMLTTALEISRAEAGIGRDRFVETDIGALLDDLVEVYGPLAEDKGMLLTSVVPPRVKASIHRELISQALANLIENALKYAEGGSQIIVGANIRGDELLLSVGDNGIGIAPERRDEARKRFRRLDPARHVPGSGLGLSLVEAVAKLHHGSMLIEDNKPGLRVILMIGAVSKA
jgi:signal transduction histidine kinase